MTTWKKKEEFGTKFSLLSVAPKTGRTHQIRVHLSYAGHPILGDPVYGHKGNGWKRHLPLKDEILLQINRQMLHAETLGFVHPDSENYCEFQAPLPKEMEIVLNRLELIDLQEKKEKKLDMRKY